MGPQEPSKRRVTITYDGSEYIINADNDITGVFVHTDRGVTQWTPLGGFKLYSDTRSPAGAGD